MWCCARRLAPQPDLVTALPTAQPRDSRNVSATFEKKSNTDQVDHFRTDDYIIASPVTEVDVPRDVEEPTPPPRSPSIQVEDYSEKSVYSVESRHTSPAKSPAYSKNDTVSQKSVFTDESKLESAESEDEDEKRVETPVDPISRVASPSGGGPATPSPEPAAPAAAERDVRRELSECALPPQHERWEQVVSGLAGTARLAADQAARAPPAAWRAAARAAALHVRSLRSRVAREACGAVGALFEHRGAVLEPELEDAAAALLDRCADVNRFIRADATEALARVACGSAEARTVTTLARRGAAHKAGPSRAAAAAALARLAGSRGVARLLAPGSARALLLRAAGELLADAHPDPRRHARALCCHLATDARFPQLLRDAMPPTRYQAIKKTVDNLRTT